MWQAPKLQKNNTAIMHFSGFDESCPFPQAMIVLLSGVVSGPPALFCSWVIFERRLGPFLCKGPYCAGDDLADLIAFWAATLFVFELFCGLQVDGCWQVMLRCFSHAINDSSKRLSQLPSVSLLQPLLRTNECNTGWCPVNYSLLFSPFWNDSFPN